MTSPGIRLVEVAELLGVSQRPQLEVTPVTFLERT